MLELDTQIIPAAQAMSFFFWSCSAFKVRKEFYVTLSYGLMWILKWVFGSILTGNNFFTDAIDAAKLRSGASFDPISFSDVFFTNLTRHLNNNEIYLILTLALFALVLFCIWLYLDADGSIAHRRLEIASFLVPIVLVSILVPLWYKGFIQHSFWHPSMTNRDCWVFGFALALGSSRFIELIAGSFKADTHWSSHRSQIGRSDAFPNKLRHLHQMTHTKIRPQGSVNRAVGAFSNGHSAPNQWAPTFSGPFMLRSRGVLSIAFFMAGIVGPQIIPIGRAPKAKWARALAPAHFKSTECCL